MAGLTPTCAFLWAPVLSRKITLLTDFRRAQQTSGRTSCLFCSSCFAHALITLSHIGAYSVPAAAATVS